MTPGSHVLVRIETKDGLIKHSFIRTDVIRDPSNQWNRVQLCRAFGLDEIACWFELPNSIRTVEACSLVNGRTIDGYIYQGPKDTTPIGKMVICYPSERFKEHDAEQGGHLRLGR